MSKVLNKVSILVRLDVYEKLSLEYMRLSYVLEGQENVTYLNKLHPYHAITWCEVLVK